MSVRFPTPLDGGGCGEQDAHIPGDVILFFFSFLVGLNYLKDRISSVSTNGSHH